MVARQFRSRFEILRESVSDQIFLRPHTRVGVTRVGVKRESVSRESVSDHLFLHPHAHIPVSRIDELFYEHWEAIRRTRVGVRSPFPTPARPHTREPDR